MTPLNFKNFCEEKPELAEEVKKTLEEENIPYTHADVCERCGHISALKHLINGCLIAGGSNTCPSCQGSIRSHFWHDYHYAPERIKSSRKYANNMFAYDYNKIYLWKLSMGCPHIMLNKSVVDANAENKKEVSEQSSNHEMALVFDYDNQIVYEVCAHDSMRPILYNAAMGICQDYFYAVSIQNEILEEAKEIYIEDHDAVCVDLSEVNNLQLFIVDTLKKDEVIVTTFFRQELVSSDVFMKLGCLLLDYVARSYMTENARRFVGYKFSELIHDMIRDDSVVNDYIKENLKYISPINELYYKLCCDKEYESSDDLIANDETPQNILGEALYRSFETSRKLKIQLKSHSLHLKKYKKKPEIKEIKPGEIMLPQDIKKYLSTRIYKQEEAQKAAATMLYNHLCGRKQNIMFVGPSGVGKTEIFRALKKIYPSIYIVDVSKITKEGFKGDYKVETMITSLLELQVPKEMIEHAIFVLDEFDKFCRPCFNSHDENISLGTQGELLKIIEGGEFIVEEHGIIDTSHMSFAFCGAFEFIRANKSDEKHIGFGVEENRLHTGNIDEIQFDDQDFINEGVTPEVLGRIDGFVGLEPLYEEDMEYMLRHGTNGVGIIEEMEETYGVKLYLSDDEIKQLARKASQNRMGIRNLRNLIKMRCNDKIYENNG